MKKTFLITTFSLIAALLIIGCSEDDNIDNYDIDDHVADEIAATIGNDNSGLSSEIVEIANLGDDYEMKSTKSNSDTVFSVDTTFFVTNQTDAIITFSYKKHMEYGYVFGSDALNLYYNGTADGSFDAPRLSSNNNRTSNWSLTGLEISSSYYILNGTTERSGVTQSKVGNKSQISSDMEITLSDVLIDKSSYVITEGKLYINIFGSINTESFDYNATVNYIGNGTAELDLNGKIYIIDIDSGEIISE